MNTNEHKDMFKLATQLKPYAFRKLHKFNSIPICVYLCLFVVVCPGLLVGCASDFVTDPTRPRPTRAVQSPIDLASPNSEAIGPPSDVVPVVVVQFPNTKDEQPVVRTIFDPQGAHLPAPALTSVTPIPASPTTQPAQQSIQPSAPPLPPQRCPHMSSNSKKRKTSSPSPPIPTATSISPSPAPAASAACCSNAPATPGPPRSTSRCNTVTKNHSQCWKDSPPPKPPTILAASR